MKTGILRRAAAVFVMALLAGFARPSGATPYLVFIDDFSTAPLGTSSPPPGQPGGGTIGGTGFWTSDSRAMLDNGSLLVYPLQGTDASLRSGAQSEFSFMTMPAGQGLLLSVRDIEMDWGVPASSARLSLGFTVNSGTYWTSTDGRGYLQIFGSNGNVRVILNTGATENAIISWTPAGGVHPTGFDFYIDSVHYGLTVYYSDNTQRETNQVAHGEAGSTWSNNMHLRVESRSFNTGVTASNRIGQITVTQIPEPGSGVLAILSLLGGAAILRRARRRA